MARLRGLLSLLLVLQLVLLPARGAKASPTDHSTLAMDRGIEGGPSASSVSADPFTGAASYAIPIEVPPGTGGMAPALSLRYSSAGPRDSWVGSRWILSLPSISRSLKRGTPSYDDAEDVFTYGGQELVLVSGTNPLILPAEYRTRRDSFVRIVRETNDTWTVTQKDGTRQRFGTTTLSRIEAPLGTFEWLLDSVVDTNRNGWTVEYDRSNEGTAYPLTIRYTLRAHPTTGALGSIDGNSAKDRTINFMLEARPDVSETYLAGFRRVMAKRLAQVNLVAAGTLVRRYVLRYSESPDSFRSLLDEVELQGSQGVASPFVTRFTYHSNVAAGTTGWALAPSWTWPAGLTFVNTNEKDQGVRLGDVDGDGLPDLIKSFVDINLTNQTVVYTPDSGVYLNLGSGWSTTEEQAPSPWVLPPSNPDPILDPYFTMDVAGTGGGIWGSGKIVLDVTGDGRVDFLSSTIAVNPGGDPDTTVLNDANGPGVNPDPLITPFSIAPWYASSEAGWVEGGPTGWLASPAFANASLAFFGVSDTEVLTLGGNSRFADMNGDGLPEWIVRGTQSVLGASQNECKGGTAAMSYVLPNRGDLNFPIWGTVLYGTLTIPESPGGQNPACAGSPYYYSTDWQPCDPVTGGDVCKEYLFHNRTYVKNDSGYRFKRHFELGVDPIDINSDGLADHVVRYEVTGDLKSEVYMNDGARGFVSGPETVGWDLPDILYKIGGSDTSSTDQGARFADVNGDGRVDLVVARTTPSGGNDRATFLNDGDGLGPLAEPTAWRSAPAWEMPENFQNAGGADRGVRLLDVNGDGMVDIVRARGNTRELLLNRGSTPDLLVEVENPLGGLTSVEYTPSTAFDNTGGDGVPDLPQVIPVVAALSVDDGNGVVSTTTFEYEGGKYDVAQREFRGFGQVTSTRADGRTTTTRFFQGDSDAGLVWDAVTLNPAGNTIDLAAFTYTSDDDGLPPYTILPASVLRGDSYPRLEQTLFEYDDGGPIVLGNRTAVTELGQVAIFLGVFDVDPADNRTRELVYNPNLSSYLVDRVSVARLREGNTPGSGAILQEARFFYDGSSSLTAPPTAGNVTKRVDVLGEAGLPDPTTTYTYDEYGNRTSATDPRANAVQGGGTTTVEFDATFHAFPSAVVNALGHRREFSYASAADCATKAPGSVPYPEGAGLVHVERGPNELSGVAFWLTCYDAYGRLVYEEAPQEQARLRRVYQDDASLGVSRQDLRRVDGNNEASTKTFVDGLGRAYRTEGDGPQGQKIVVDTSYDALGRIASETVPYFLSAGPGSEYVYEHDFLDRLVRKSLDGVYLAETFAYDSGWVTSTDANGKQQRRLVDTFGRVAEVQEESSEGDTSTTYAYDARDLLVAVVDHGGNETLIDYDLLGQKRSVDDPDAGLTTFAYDANGNVLRRDDAGGHFVTWTYDALDRPKSQRLDGAGTDDVTWTYDTASYGFGRLRSRTDRVGVYTVGSYDHLGNVRNEGWTAGGFSHNFQNTYNFAGELKTRSYPGSPRRTLTWLRDVKGFLTSITSGGSAYASGITWDAQGRLTDWTAENGVDTSLEFTATHLRYLTVTGAATLENLEYVYDAGDRVRQVRDLRVPSLNRTYHYDDRDRLVRAEGPFGASQAYANLYYRYDALGNLVCKDSATAVGSGGASACTSAGGKALVYPAPGPAALRPHAPTQVDGQAASYDGRGNLTALGSRTYEYNALGQVAVVRDSGSAKATFTYDGTGRLGKIVDTSASTVERFLLAPDFEWNKTGAIARIQVQLGGLTVAVHEAAYTPQPPGSCSGVAPGLSLDDGGGSPELLVPLLANLLATWLAWCVLWLLWRRPRGTRARAALALGLGVAVFVFTSVPSPLSPLASRPAQAAFPGTVVYLHADVLGSSVLTTDQTGAVVQRASYKPFGDAAPGSSPVPEFGFTGQRFVAGVKIYDYGARWYDPGLGRFLQPDSIVPEPFDPQSLNRYSYVRNSPTNRLDPTGNFDVLQGLTDFFTEGIPSFFTDTLGGFFSSIPSFADGAFDSFYSSLVGPVVSGIEGLIDSGLFADIDATLAPEVLLDDDPNTEAPAASLASSQGQQLAGWPANDPEYGENLAFGTPAPSEPGFLAGALGKLWTLPNTAIGALVGLAGVPFGARPQLGNNAIEFTGFPIGATGALTLGNVILYRNARPEVPDFWYGVFQDTGRHERAHTFQAQLLGPFYLPAYLLGGPPASLSNSFERAATDFSTYRGSWWPW